MAKLFRGRFDCKIDEKGRCSWPAAYRSLLSTKANQLVITNSQYQGKSILDIYTLAQWEKLEAKIGKMPSLNKQVQAYRRFYLSGGQTINVDSHGRFLVPASLRAFAQIKEDVVLVGMGEKVEMWPAQTWVKVQDEMANQFEDILQAVAQIEEESTH